jgi:N-sulfoglucosamine sulfohydrolase
LKTIAGAAALFMPWSGDSRAAGPAAPTNVLLITADDMNYNSVGAYGCGISNITPHIDQLAAEGLRFENAHITIAVCQPSRSVLMTGRYPHRNGAEGFEPIDGDVTTLQERLNAAGCLNGILSKTTHLQPTAKFFWDTLVLSADLGVGRDPALYYQHAKAFFDGAKAAGKPFFLMANSQDPHRPFADSQQEWNKWGEHKPFSRRITEIEAEIPGFLPELPDVRTEIAEYFTSVHRCDETVGEVLRALSDAGLEDDTLVMFLSDNGMALPFSKTNCYLNSTKTPWIVRWPGHVAPGTVDTEHFISGIDYMPTIIEAAGLAPVEGMDGQSFLPLLTGGAEPWRDKVFTVFHETSAERRYEMRCVQNAEFGYIYNAWSNGATVFKNESQNGLTMDAMKDAAQTDPDIAARVELFLYRVPEEFYDFRNDPDALNNLIGDAAHKERADWFRRQLAQWMRRFEDPLWPQYEAQVMADVPPTAARNWRDY